MAESGILEKEAEKNKGGKEKGQKRIKDRKVDRKGRSIMMRKMIINFSKREILAVLLAVIMVFLSGCQNTGGMDADMSQGGAPSFGAASQSASDQPKAMGRYLEDDMEFPEEIRNVKDMKMLPGGKLAVFENTRGIFISKDNGKSFKRLDKPFLNEILRSKDFHGIKYVSFNENGDYLASYFSASDPTAENTEFFYGKISGEARKLELAQEAQYFTWQEVLSDGRMVGGADDEVYEISPDDGKLTLLCKAQGFVNYQKAVGSRLYLVSAKGLEIFDLQQNGFVEDAVLEDFIREEDTDSGRHILIEQGDSGDCIYVATVRGLFRHVVGGSVMEEMMKGSLSSLGQPNLTLRAMAFSDAQQFWICYDFSGLKSYVYDADSPSVPEKNLKIYSLWEDEFVRTSANYFARVNPDIYVSYEVGMTGQDGVTREDAVKRLNLELLSGDGPDVIVLDGLPMESYLEKGVLKDIAPLVVKECGDGTVFENIATAYEKDGEIRAVPAFFAFPVITGKEGDGVSDLKSLADRVEELRQEYPEGNIIFSAREKDVLLRLYHLSSPAFIGQDGRLEKENVAEYLRQAKRIWDAEKVSIRMPYPDDDAGWEEQEQSLEEFYGSYDKWAECGTADIDYRMGDSRLLFKFYSSVNADYACSVYDVKERSAGIENIRILDGLSKNVFRPAVILGVNAGGKNPAEAEAFIKDMLEAKMQLDADGNAIWRPKMQYMGFPVCKTAVDHTLGEKEAGEFLLGQAASSFDGTMWEWRITQPSGEEFERLYQMIGSLETPAYMDETVKEVIIEQGILALREEKSIEEAADEIYNRVQIYLTE